MEDLPPMMTITKLLATAPRQQLPSQPSSAQDQSSNVLKIHCLRLESLSQRTSAVMKVSEGHFDRLDPVINIFRTFGKLNEVLVTAKMAIVPDDSFADSVQYQALKSKAEMVIVPWTSNLVHVNGSPVIPQDEFIKQALDKVESHVSVMIDTSLHIDDESPSEPSLSRSISMSSLRIRATRTTSSSEIEPSPMVQLHDGYQVFLPYFGGKDDRVALMMVIQLLRSSNVKATVVRIRYGDESGQSSVAAPVTAHTNPSKEVAPVTEAVHSGKATSPLTSVMSSAMARVVRFPEVLRAPSSMPETSVIDAETAEDDDHVASLLDSIPFEIKSQLKIENVTTSTPLQYVVKRAKKEIDSTVTNYHLIIVGRGTKFPRTTNLTAILRNELKDLVKGGQAEMLGKDCLGDVGDAMMLGRVTGGLLVVQSSKIDDES